MEGIKRFVECLIPVTACNLKCGYCYVIQRQKNKGKMPQLRYSVEIIKKALSKERMDGICYFSICGAGETLLPKETLDIAKALLANGHYVNITTNGTITNRIHGLINMLSDDERSRLHFSFSFHYLELLRIGKIETFFENVRYVRKNGASYLVQLNLYDDYLPHLDEIKNLCLANVGALPQIAATRKENNLSTDVELMTAFSVEEYLKKGREFDSPLFEFTMKNFGVKRKEYCYAGDWAFTLNLATGIMRRCYACNQGFNIFEDPESKIPFCAIGRHCKSLFCMNSSHFMSFGVIPEVQAPFYSELRNRRTSSGEEWYTDVMKKATSMKLEMQNKKATPCDMLKSDIFEAMDFSYGCLAKAKNKLLTVVRKDKNSLD